MCFFVFLCCCFQIAHNVLYPATTFNINLAFEAAELQNDALQLFKAFTKLLHSYCLSCCKMVFITDHRFRIQCCTDVRKICGTSRLKIMKVNVSLSSWDMSHSFCYLPG